jgi:hypothetical protein
MLLSGLMPIWFRVVSSGHENQSDTLEMMSPDKKFSVRQGVAPEPKPKLEEAPQGLRYFLLKFFEQKYRGYPGQAAEILENFLRQPGLRGKFHNPYDPNAWTKFYGYIEGFEWWQVYDLIEEIFAAEASRDNRLGFVRKVNDVLAEENCCWRMNYSGEIVYEGSESFEAAVKTATSILAAVGRNTAKDEMNKAVQNLSKRPHPDLTGAVQHAMVALECVARDVCGATNVTLGDVIKRHPDKFPRPVGDAVSKLYGFASERGRHITEGGEPDQKEVELIVGIAATVATYLSR